MDSLHMSPNQKVISCQFSSHFSSQHFSLRLGPLLVLTLHTMIRGYIWRSYIFVTSYSYACDDFIVNDTPDSKLDSIRSKLLSLVAASTDGVGPSSGEKGKQKPMRRSSTGYMPRQQNTYYPFLLTNLTLLRTCIDSCY